MMQQPRILPKNVRVLIEFRQTHGRWKHAYALVADQQITVRIHVRSDRIRPPEVANGLAISQLEYLARELPGVQNFAIAIGNPGAVRLPVRIGVCPLISQDQYWLGSCVRPYRSV